MVETDAVNGKQLAPVTIKTPYDPICAFCKKKFVTTSLCLEGLHRKYWGYLQKHVWFLISILNVYKIVLLIGE